eukprot:gnl/MRDRNA2_/MRDRNA2_22066_c0_seq1.p1 gnl/MRDRNA2_/MRDRNA2_22066_c0~~gnl/MRDRNA2_/MRDRNA2_22066_c0_seq1.p1  ORF type:complete len:132 (-),score=7.48 gnl/MRDRNA2_/MRDRNA2_22066_c0_seq1:405-800(-)
MNQRLLPQHTSLLNTLIDALQLTASHFINRAMISTNKTNAFVQCPPSCRFEIAVITELWPIKEVRRANCVVSQSSTKANSHWYPLPQVARDALELMQSNLISCQALLRSKVQTTVHRMPLSQAFSEALCDI